MTSFTVANREAIRITPTYPEKALIVAMITRSIFDLHSPEEHIVLEAKRWIFSDDEDPFSFLWCLASIYDISTEDALYFAKLIRGRVQELTHYYSLYNVPRLSGRKSFLFRNVQPKQK